MIFNTPSYLPNSFDRVAWFYDALAQVVFGKAQLRAQAYFLHQIPENSRVLLLGGGSGWLLEQLLLQRCSSKILYLEASSKMLALAQQRVAKHSTSTIEWRLGTEKALRPNERFDVLITPFVLDLFTQQQLEQEILPTLLSSLSPSGSWLFTDFARPTIWWQHLLARAMFAFFRPLTTISATKLPDFDLLFAHFHYHRIASSKFYNSFIEAAVLMKTQAILS